MPSSPPEGAARVAERILRNDDGRDHPPEQRPSWLASSGPSCPRECTASCHDAFRLAAHSGTSSLALEATLVLSFGTTLERRATPKPIDPDFTLSAGDVLPRKRDGLSRRFKGALIVVWLLAALPLLDLGYGSDQDAWLVAQRADEIWQTRKYARSRSTGFPL